MAAAAATAVQTNELMTAIQGVALTGMAHNGIDNIPREGTWLLDGGERVLNPQQNKDLTNYLNNRQNGLVRAMYKLVSRLRLLMEPQASIHKGKSKLLNL